MRVNSGIDERVERIASIGGGAEFELLLRQLSTCARLDRFRSLNDLVTLESLRHPPQCVLLLHSRSGQFRECDYQTARRLFPEAKWLAVIGSYAEGEMRSGEPLTGIERVHWTAAVDRWFRLSEIWEGLDAADAQRSRLEGTAADRLVAVNAGTRPFPYRVGVVAASPNIATPVMDACAAVGFCAELLSSRLCHGPKDEDLATSLNLCIWVNEYSRANGPQPLNKITAMLAPCPTLVLSDFVRWEDREDFIRRGAADVLARPFVLEDLVGFIGRLARPSALRSRAGNQRQAS